MLLIRLSGLVSIFAFFYFLKNYSNQNHVITNVQLCLSSILIINGLFYLGIEYIILKTGKNEILQNTIDVASSYLLNLIKISPLLILIVFFVLKRLLEIYFNTYEIIFLITSSLLFFPIYTYSILLKRKKSFIAFQIIRSLIPNVALILLIILVLFFLPSCAINYSFLLLISIVIGIVFLAVSDKEFVDYVFRIFKNIGNERRKKKALESLSFMFLITYYFLVE